MSTHHPNKEQAGSCTNKDGKVYVKHHRKTNIWVREKTKVTTGLIKSEDRSGSGQDTSAEYKVTDGHCVSPSGNHRKGRPRGRPAR